MVGLMLIWYSTYIYITLRKNVKWPVLARNRGITLIL